MIADHGISSGAASWTAGSDRRGADGVPVDAWARACERPFLAKLNQNITYKAEHDICEAAKTGGKAACEAQKAVHQGACQITNVHSGDLIGPMTVNLFRRSLQEDPLILASSLISAGSINRHWDVRGSRVRHQRRRTPLRRRIETTLETILNLIVKLIVSEIRAPNPTSRTAILVYADQRPYSYGSYLGSYRTQYGYDAKDIKARIDDGIASGWQPDCSPVMGAVRLVPSPGHRG